LNGNKLQQLNIKLHGQYSNNQAEQIKILISLQKQEELQEGKDKDKRAAIYTDCKIIF